MILPFKNEFKTTKFPFYVIEGIDGSGKSSLGPLVAESIDASFHEYPIAFKPAINIIDEKASPEARFMFYMGYNVQTSHDVSLLAQEGPVVCVRYLYSTMVYHLIKGVNEKMVFDIAKSTPLLRPDIVFFLDVSDQKVHIERLKERGVLAEDNRVLEKMNEIRHTYFRLAPIMPNFTPIDTSYMSKSEVINAIVKSII